MSSEALVWLNWQVLLRSRGRTNIPDLMQDPKPEISHVNFAFCSTAALQNAKITWEMSVSVDL